MSSDNKFVTEAKQFFGWGSLTGKTREDLEACVDIKEALLLIPTFVRRIAEHAMKAVDLEVTNETLFFVSLGIMGDTDFSYCARAFQGDTRKKLILLEAQFDNN